MLFLILLTFIGIPGQNNFVASENFVPGFTTKDGCTLSLIDSYRLINQVVDKSSYDVTYDYNFYTGDLPDSCFFKIVGNDPAYYNIEENLNIQITIGLPFFSGFMIQILIALLFILFFSNITFKKFDKFKIFQSIILSYLFMYNIFFSNEVAAETLINEYEKILLFYSIIILFGFVINNMVDHDGIPKILPYSIIFYGLIYSSSLNVWYLLLAFLGINNDFKKYKKFNIGFFILSSIWLFNLSSFFYFDPDKIRGSIVSSTNEINYLSILLVVFYIFHGLIYLYNIIKKSKYFVRDIYQSSLNSGFILSIVGLTATFLPELNIIFQLFFLNIRNSMNSLNLTDYGSWRGFYPSAEAAGEIYFIILSLAFFTIYKTKKISNKEIVKLLVIIYSFYKTGAASSYLLLIIFIIFVVSTNKKRLFNYLIVFGLFLILMVSILPIVDLPIENDYQSAIKVNYYKINNFTLENIVFLENGEYSSTIKMLSYLPKPIKSSLILLADLINRDTVWSYTISRYDTNLIGSIFGSGIGLTSDYFKVSIPENNFLLPHSSIFTTYMYFGLLGLTYLVASLTKYLKISFSTYDSSGLMFLYFLVVINWLKTDSIFYIGNLLFIFVVYSAFITISENYSK